MHNYHTNGFSFHANGDPIPSDVLIHPINGDHHFRSTSEEIVAFCGAVRLGAVGHTTVLRTTVFDLNGPNVTLRLLTPLEGEVWNMIVPLADLQTFATLVLQRRFELFVSNRFNGSSTDAETMAGIGLFYASTGNGSLA